MPQDYRAVIEKLVADGEPDEVIDGVIRELKNQEYMEKPGEPGDFWGGVKQSLAPGGAASNAMDKGVEGFIQGAVGNLPETVANTGRMIWGMASDPINTYGNMVEGLINAPSNIARIASRAGTEPEAFGEMMGEMTGQPLATAGLSRGAPPVARAAVNNAYRAGPPLRAIGRFAAEQQPITGFMPPIATPHHVRVLERLGGRFIEDIGRRLENTKPLPKVTVEGRPTRVTSSQRVNPTSTSLARQTPQAASRRGIAEPSSRLLEKMEMQEAAPPVNRRPPRLLPSHVSSRPIELRSAPERLPASTMSRERFPQGRVYDRWKELVEKERNSTLTAEELQEARLLDKKMRRADIEPIDVNTGEYIK